MNIDLCNKILQNKELFVPSIFTHKQIIILDKYLNKKKLTNTEKTYLYSAIKKKINALSILNQEFYIKGNNMISERIKKAQQILKQLNKKAFISGSFLYSKKYNDIDIYIISKKRKQYHKKEKHFVFIAESDLKIPMFASALNHSISNFEIPTIKINKKRSSLNENILAYQLAIKNVLENQEPESLKYLIIEYYLNIENKLLNSYELSKKYKEIINSKNNVEQINILLKKIILNLYSHRYIYDILVKFTKKLEKNIKEYSANQNLILYKNLFDKIKNECRATKI